MGLLERDAVKRVINALAAMDINDRVVELEQTAATAKDAANALKVSQGAIVKSLVFMVGEQPVMALVAGDKNCQEHELARIFHLTGDATRPDADKVLAVTGFSIGGVAPVGLLGGPIPTAIDASLKRFAKVYAAAGHPNCVFETNVKELKKMTGGLVSYALAMVS
ncbi:MAG: YbaK/EbsC family protein [Rhodospirillaceae bacterium]|nr:YbaK/EbsC family protein [Rhodospirillaceae bacterium]